MINRNPFYWLVPALLIAVLFFGCGRKPGEKLYAEALNEWKDGNHVRARALMEKSIRRRTGSLENADAYNRLGLLLWEMDEIDAAVDAFEESCRIDAGQYGPLCNLGVALSAKNDFVAAESAFREAALLQPYDPRPIAYTGIAYLQNEKWEDANRNLRRALSRTPKNPRLQTLLAITELHTRDANAALRRLQTIARNHPNYATAFFNIASIHFHWLNNPTEAKRNFTLYLEKASRTDTFVAKARANLLALGVPAETPTLNIRPPKKANRTEAEKSFRKALLLHQNGNLEKAIVTYIQALEKDDTYERAFYNLGLAYYAAGKTALAGEAFGRAVKINPAFTDARYNAALVSYYYLNQTDNALRELNVVLSQKPDYQPAINLLKIIKGK